MSGQAGSGPPSAALLLEQLGQLSAVQRPAYWQAVGGDDDLLLRLSDEVEQLALSEVSRALPASEAVLGLADAVGGAGARARARRARAQALAASGRFRDALPLTQEAVQLARSAGQMIEAARAHMASMQSLASLGEFDEAIAAGLAARGAFESVGQPELAARADSNLGLIYWMRDDARAALEHFDRARAVLSAQPAVAAQLDVNRAHALLALGDFAAAESAYRAALPVFESQEMLWAAAVVEQSLAELAIRHGRLQEGLFHFERARRRLERDEAPGELARMRLEQADALARLGLNEEARAEYEAVWPELVRHGLRLESVRALAGLGTTLVRLGQFDAAAPQLDAAAAGLEALDQVTERDRLELVRAELASAQGRAEEAVRLARGAAERLSGRPADAAQAYGQLARAALFAGDVELAGDAAERGLASAQAFGAAPLIAELEHTRGRLLRRRGDLAGACAALRTAIGHLERVRGALQAERFRSAFLGDRLSVYEDLISAALHRGADGVADAFWASEHARSRLLLESLQSSGDWLAHAMHGADEAEAALLRDLLARRAELNVLYSRLADARDGKAGVQAAAVAADIARQERELEQLEARLATTRGLAGVLAQPLDLAAALRLTPAGAALVEFIASDGQLHALVLRDGGAHSVSALAVEAEVAEQVRRVHFQMRRAVRPGALEGGRGLRLIEDSQRELCRLWELVLAPLEPLLEGAAALILVPHGVLHTAPLHACFDGRRYLAERCAVQYAPSASVLATAGRGAPLRGERPLLVAAPDEGAPQIEAELERLAALLPQAERISGPDATVEALTRAATGRDLIHIACHGQFASENPLASGLKLADRWLTVREIYNLRLSAGLVTLSGCETGRNSIGTGDELVGLVRAFLAAGAGALLVSLWIVNDDSTASLMERMYRRVRYNGEQGQSGRLATALRDAQLETLAERPHPAHWAAFILTGGL